MNATDHNGLGSTQVVEEAPLHATPDTPPSANGNAPFVPTKDKPKSILKENGRLVLIGAGIVLVLLLLAFNGISRHSVPAQKNSAAAKQPQTAKPDSAVAASSVTPILDAGRAPSQETDRSLVKPDQIGRTATKQTKPSPVATLGDVKPFDGSQWQPAPYQPGAQPAPTGGEVSTAGDATQIRSEHDALDKASLVFVRNNASSAANQRPQDVAAPIELGVGLAPGTRLRARLESAVNTAVRTPVVAVVEYNYEQNGEIVIPAGAKAFGHLESADRSGYVGIRFDSLLMPDGSTVALEAAATDLQLRPLRGKVEGKHTGKNVLVRSVTGIGEVAAALVGRGSANQPLSESDLLRERVANNIGQAGDQTVANLALTERVVVSVPGDTEIYVVLQKAAKENVQSSRVQAPAVHSQANIEELRQLMQLQRELNQTSGTKAPE
jgi:type F conjugative transfer system protein TrbI